MTLARPKLAGRGRGRAVIYAYNDGNLFIVGGGVRSCTAQDAPPPSSYYSIVTGVKYIILYYYGVIYQNKLIFFFDYAAIKNLVFDVLK